MGNVQEPAHANATARKAIFSQRPSLDNSITLKPPIEKTKIIIKIKLDTDLTYNKQRHSFTYSRLMK